VAVTEKGSAGGFLGDLIDSKALVVPNGLSWKALALLAIKDDCIRFFDLEALGAIPLGCLLILFASFYSI
jgi:hypothetical protein